MSLIEQEQKEYKIMYSYSQKLLEIQTSTDEEEIKKTLEQLKQACKIMLSINQSQINKTKQEKIILLIHQENTCLDRITRMIDIIIHSNKKELMSDILGEIEDFKELSKKIQNELVKELAVNAA